MLFNLSPKFPIRSDEQSWVDDSLSWLRESFGEEIFRHIPVVLPTEAFFTEDFDGTPENTESVFRTICQRMMVDRSRVTLQTYQDSDRATDAELRQKLPAYQSGGKGVAGYYAPPSADDKIVIAIEQSLLTEPTAVIATMAHEVGHVVLLADNRIVRETENMEPLTDLTTVFFGFGIFSANSAFQFKQRTTGWSIRRQGYLSQEMYGYALARWATLRDDNNPTWTKYLSTNVQAYCKQSLNAIRHQARGR